MTRPLSFNTFKELLPFAVILVSVTAWGVIGFAMGESNSALTNQKIDQLIELRRDDKLEFNSLTSEVGALTKEVNRLANIVDRADDRGLLGQGDNKGFLAIAAPNLAAITPTPPQMITYHTTIERTAGESAQPTPTLYSEPTPTPQAKPTPLLCVLGICTET